MSTIKRSKRNTPFVLINKESLQDKSISWQAKGLLSYLLSLPDDWQILVADLANRSKNGKDSTASILNELIKAGYIERKKIKDEKNRFGGYDYTVFDCPKQETPKTETPKTEKPKTEKPFTEISFTETPKTEKPQLLSNNLTKNTFTKKPKSITPPQNKTDLEQSKWSEPTWKVELKSNPLFLAYNENLQTSFLEYCDERHKALFETKKYSLSTNAVNQNIKLIQIYLKAYSMDAISESLNFAIRKSNVDFNPLYVINSQKTSENKTFDKKPNHKDIPLLTGDLNHLNTWNK